MLELLYNNPATPDIYKKYLSTTGLDIRLKNLTDGELDLNQPPDNITFLNQVQPEFNKTSKDGLYLEQYLEYLLTYNRKVLNAAAMLATDLNKLERLKLFKRSGLNFPLTTFSADPQELYRAAVQIPLPVHLYRDRSVYLYGENRFEEMGHLHFFLTDKIEQPPPDTLFVQQFIPPTDDIINNAVFLDNDLVAVIQRKLDTDDITLSDDDHTNHPLIKRFAELATGNGYTIAVCQFVEALNGVLYVLDISGTIDPLFFNNKLFAELYFKKLIEII